MNTNSSTSIQKALTAIRERQSKSELKPCPFCGGEALICEREFSAVYCTNHGCMAEIRGEGDDYASLLWNTRAEYALLSRLIAACEVMAKELEGQAANNRDRYNAAEALAKATAILEGKDHG